ncbi:MAG: Cell division coordinator CpoB [Chlamydiia bacterium]|nr:Cell division coordinator CpoB [Chlamydiia bacterium]MCH9624257.1 Cell division coordinator CpoB [Chlamydiia bacterium]
MPNISHFKGTKYLSFKLAVTASLMMGALSGAPNYDNMSKEEGFMLRRITEFWKDQDYKTVKSEIKRFQKTHKNSKFCDQLHGNLGDLLIQEGKYKEALESYLKITHKDVAIEFLLNKMQCYYELERYDELITAGMPSLTEMTKELLDRRDEFFFLMAEGYFRSALSYGDTDRKNTNLNKALPLYEKILNSSFHNPTTFALAEIYRLQGANDKAATFFLELATTHPERKEELLFHAALSQAEFDKPLAIRTFTKIIGLNGEKAKDAALNRLILYFGEEKYNNVISNYEEVLELAAEDKKPTLEYIIARSYFAQKEYIKAGTHLDNFIAYNQGTTDEKRNALLMQLSTAQFLKDEGTYRSILEKLARNFPEDPELSQAIFIHAMMLKEMDQPDAAEAVLTSLIKGKNNLMNQEVLKLEYGLVAYNNKNWELAKNTLLSFTDTYKDSKHSAVAWKYLLSSALNLLKAGAEEKNPSYSKEEFLNDLDKIMVHADVLDKGEKVECLFLQGKLSYELGKYEDALTRLGSFIFDNQKSEHISEAYLLSALCYHKTNASIDLFCTNAEKAMQLDKSLEKKGALHIELFNAYLTIAKKSEYAENLTKKAREHLYAALSLGEKDIKLENKLWLANSYLSELAIPLQSYAVDTHAATDDTMFNRCTSLFEEILLDDVSKSLANITEKNTFLEWEVLKYAKLLGKKDQSSQKVSILKALVEAQAENKTQGWKAKEEVLFELAKTYEGLGKKDEALETYSFLAQTKKGDRTFIEEYSKLNSLRLHFEKLPEASKAEENNAVFDILSTLKDMQIKKNPLSEPLHLEAALEYAKIRGAIAEGKTPHIKYLFFLGRVREDFNDKSDPLTVKYKEELSKIDGMSDLFTKYMKFVDAEAFRMEAIIKAKDGHMAMSYELSRKAEQLLKNLESGTLSIYLSSRVKESQELLKNGTFL